MLAPNRIHKVRDEREYQATLKQIEKLWNAEVGTADHDLLEVLVILVEAYERETVNIGPPDPIEAIKFRMEQSGLRPRDLVQLLGTQRVSEVLQGKRRLTLTMIRNLHTKLGIPLECLVGA